MKEKCLNTIGQIRRDEKTMRRLYLITLVSCLLVLSLVVRNGLEGGKYIIDEEGQVIGIERKSLQAFEEYELILKVTGELGELEKEVLISKSAVEPEATREEEEAEAAEREREAALMQRDIAIGNILMEIEASEKRRILFPRKLPDGSTLSWHTAGRGQSELPMLAGLYLVLILIVVKAGIDERKRPDAIGRASVLRSLPRFVNQLVMLLNAGMILNDAFECIAESCTLVPEQERGLFETDLAALAERNRDHRTGTAMILNEYAGKINVKELMRISTILIENERRGSDVVDNLTRESEFLWEERKITAMEKGKMIDAKMAYPLGMLLILLIIITMAPAILTMK